MRNGDADAVGNVEGSMDRSDSASFCPVPRSRRTQSTLRNFMHENRETSAMPASRAGSRPAGEGQGRKARVNVVEESDSGIVPMNHSNKTKVAESGEGRPLIKENTRP